jgi:acyl-CoA thioesterase I
MRGDKYVVMSVNPPALLGEAFCQKYGGRVAVTSHGNRGGTTSSLLLGGERYTERSWDSEMAQSKADMVVINTAINDAYFIGTKHFPNERFVSQYEELVRVAKAQGKIVILESGNPMDNPHNTALWSITHIQHFVAQHTGVMLIDQFNDIQSVPTWRSLLSDGIHPGEMMYRLKASNEFRAIDPIVARLVQTSLRRRVDRSIEKN